MQKDKRELKKNAFLDMREAGQTYDDIRRILGVSERTLYNWSNEVDDIEFQGEQQQAVAVSEREQQLQNQLNEMNEHIDRLSHSYTNLWNQVHIRQEYAKQEINPFQLFFETFMANSDKRQSVLNQQLEVCKKFEMERKEAEGRPSKPDTYRDLHFTENVADMARWNKEIDIRNGMDPIDVGVLDLEVPIRDENAVELYTDTVEGRGFEMRIADMCLKRGANRILDRL